MSAINSFLRAVFDGALYPFRGMHPLVGLSVVSLVTAVFMLIVFKRTSNQKKLEAVKRQIHAGLFEIRLFNDDIRAIFRAQMEILRHNASYLALSIVPMVWIIVPLFFVMSHLQFHYGYSGLEPGESVMMKVDLKEDWAGDRVASTSPVAAFRASRPPISLDLPEGLIAETEGIWLPGVNEMAWRIRAEKEGDYEIGLAMGDASWMKTVHAGGSVVRRSPSKNEPKLLWQLFFPAEPSLPAESPFKSIEVAYPETDIEFLGFGLNWIIVFFLLAIVFAFVLRKPLGVTI